MRIRKNILIGAVVLLAGISVWLLVQFAAPTLNLQQALYRERWLLLTWRLALYGLAIWLWFTLTPRLQRQNPVAFRHLRRAVGWSLALLATGEISNMLQWGESL